LLLLCPDDKNVAEENEFTSKKFTQYRRLHLENDLLDNSLENSGADF